MRFSDLLALSVQNVLRGGRKSRLSICAIAVGIFSLCLITGLGDAALDEIKEKVTETGIGGITIYTSSPTGAMEAGDIEDISETVEGIDGITPFIYESGSITFAGVSHKAAFVGVNEDISRVFNMNIKFGSFFTHQQAVTSERVAIVDDELAQSLYERDNIIGKEITFTVSGTKEIFRVVGVIKSQRQGLESLTGVSLPNIVYIPYTVLNEMTGNSMTDKIAVSCLSSFSEEQVVKNVTRNLSLRTGASYKYENINQYISGLWDILDVISAFINAVALIALVTGGIGIMNSMFLTVDARRGDIGVCMALGETRRSILLGFLFEAVILCLFGGVIGMCATLAASYGIYCLSGIAVNIPVGAFIKSGLLSLLCGALCGIIPANKASRLDPIDVIIR